MIKAKHIFKSFLEISNVGCDMLLHRYPGFVYGKKLDGKEIPVFCFHGVEPESFEKMLNYIKQNQYETLSIKTYYRIMRGDEKLKNVKSLLLTFDDGTGSTWTTLYPLLKKYDFRATVFLVPGRITNRKDYLPNLEDVWSNRASMNDIYSRDNSNTPLATWEEIRIMHESGLVDFESHTHDHSLVFTSPAIVDFVNPKILAQYHPFEFPIIRKDETKVERINQLGMPLYTTKPRMSDELRYFDDSELREACKNYVKERGGVLFFKKKNWKKELFQYVKMYQADSSFSGRYETKEQQKKAITFELQKSKQMIEEKLENKIVQHICYPWGVMGEKANKISKSVGYICSFSQEKRKRAVVGQEFYTISRISEDFIYCLPGRNSDSLSGILKKKMIRRLRKGSPYLSH
jgi:hypothetical protein